MLLSASSAPAQRTDAPTAGDEAAKLAGEWTAVGGTQAGKELTKEDLAKIKFSTKWGYDIELGPVVPRGKWPTGYVCTLTPAAKQIRFCRNIGAKGVTYWGTYELKDDTLRISLQLLPWERTTGDSSFNPNYIYGTFKADTVFTFKKVKK
jgi:hypothetical protein